MQNHTLIRDHTGKPLDAARTRRDLLAYDPAVAGLPEAPLSTQGTARLDDSATGLDELVVDTNDQNDEARLDYDRFVPLQRGGVREVAMRLESFRLLSASGDQAWVFGLEAETGERVEVQQYQARSFARVFVKDPGGSNLADAETEWALNRRDDAARRRVFGLKIRLEWYGNDLDGRVIFQGLEGDTPRVALDVTTDFPRGGVRPYVRLVPLASGTYGFALSRLTVTARNN